MKIIEITSEYGANIVLCTNTETLDIRDTSGDLDEDTMVEVVEKCQDVIFDALGEFAAVCSFFRNWNGGKYFPAPLHVEWYTREVNQDLLEDGELMYDDWQWIKAEKVSQVLKDGIEALEDKVRAIIRKAQL